MTRNHLLRVGWGFLTLVALCFLLSVTQPWLTDPWQMWLACCRFVQMVLPLLISSLVIQIARLVVLIVLIVGLLTLYQRFQRMQEFATAMKLALNSETGLSAPRLQTLCAQLQLTPYVVALKTTTPLAFCYELLTPRIYISQGLVETLTDNELCAVLLHEDHHRRHYHPLHLLLADALATLFFFLPMIGAWRDHLRLTAEMAADRYAEQVVGRPPLAGALYKLLTHPATSFLPADVSGISGFSANAARIAQLLGDASPVAHFSLPIILHTSGNLVVACLVIQSALLPLLFC